jgi:hypothetical protein
MRKQQPWLDVFFVHAPVNRNVDGFCHQIDNSFSALDASFASSGAAAEFLRLSFVYMIWVGRSEGNMEVASLMG